MAKISAGEINSIQVKAQGSAPATPSAGYGQIYEKTDKKLYFLNADGTETEVTNVAGVVGNVTATSAHASPPGSPASGDLWMPNNSFYLYRYSGSVQVPWGPIFPMTAPPAADWAWINQGTATVNTTPGGLYLNVVAAAGDDLKVYKRAVPTVPYTVTAWILPNMIGAAWAGAGLCWRQSSDGKLIWIRIYHNNTGYWHFSISKWAATGGQGGAGDYIDVLSPFNSPLCLQVADNNTNRIVSISADGQNFLTLHTVGRTDYLTADEIGLAVQSVNATYAAGLTLLSWKES